MTQKSIIIIILYSVGLCGILWYNADLLLSLTPVNLLISAILILPKEKSPSFLSISSVIVLLGMCVEIIGVSSGIPFGTYHYGQNLGPLLAGVPLIIGLNWWMLAYISWTMVYPYFNQGLARILVSGVLMLVIDFLMEKIAHQLDFWYWATDSVPWQNYLSWYLIGVMFCALLDRYVRYRKNRPASTLYFAQLVFFGVLVLFLNQ
jgi:putative membrane protein